MEQIVRERTYPEAESYTPRLKLSPLLVIMFVLLVGFAVVTLGVRTVAQYSIAPSNPFPAYADVFPGQPASALEARAFSCQTTYNYNHDLTEDYAPIEESCTFTPAVGVFSSIKAIIYGDTIYQLTFIIRANTLQVGDLELFLGKSAIHIVHRVAYFWLPSGFVIARTIDHAGQFSRFLPVWSISFIDMDLLT